MISKELCTKDPNLALAFYCYCGINPKAHVCNNESLINDKTGMCNCIKAKLPKPCDVDTKLDINKKLNSCTYKTKPLYLLWRD